MDEEQFLAAMQMENPTIESIEGILEEKKRKSEEENKTAHENIAKKEAEEAARREALAKRMENGEELTPDVLADIFENSGNKNDSDKTDEK